MQLTQGIIDTARALGIDPVDLATVISYETAGTFDPTKRGPTTQWGQHKGLIQFGEPQAQRYGVDWSDPLGSQLGPDAAIANYMRDAGVQPGMGLLDVYSAVNAGRVGRYNASDANNGGASGTVADKVNNQMAGHRAKAARLLGTPTGVSAPMQMAAPNAPDPARFGRTAMAPTPAPTRANSPTGAPAMAAANPLAMIGQFLAGLGGEQQQPAPAPALPGVVHTPDIDTTDPLGLAATAGGPPQEAFPGLEQALGAGQQPGGIRDVLMGAGPAPNPSPVPQQIMGPLADGWAWLGERLTPDEIIAGPSVGNGPLSDPVAEMGRQIGAIAGPPMDRSPGGMISPENAGIPQVAPPPPPLPFDNSPGGVISPENAAPPLRQTGLPEVAPVPQQRPLQLPDIAPVPEARPGQAPGADFLKILAGLGGLLGAMSPGAAELTSVSLPGVLHKPGQFAGLPMPKGLLG